MQNWRGLSNQYPIVRKRQLTAKRRSTTTAPRAPRRQRATAQTGEISLFEEVEAPLPSIEDLVPNEQGGEEARRGLAFQDHVAVGFYLEMAGTDDLTTVWCEADDDVTLVWRMPTPAGNGAPQDEREGSSEESIGIEAGASTSLEVEFVQVKGNEHDQLWSPALLCRQKKGQNGRAIAKSSILEKSLLRDRYREPARFRIVTIRPVKRELELLELPFEHPIRQPGSAEYEVVSRKLPARVKQLKSTKNNTWAYWLARVRWDVRHSHDAVRDKNLIMLEQVLRQLQGFLAPDQRAVIYERLVRRALDAALASRERFPEKKCLRRNEVIDILRAGVTSAQRVGDDDDGLTSILTAAGLSSETVRHARESRLRYLKNRRSNSDYLPEDSERIARLEAEVGARLHSLWARLESGEIDDSPAVFYARCISALEQVRRDCGTEAPPLDLLQGMLYDRVHRRLHRFDRVSA